MISTKLNELVSRKNKALEEDAVATASEIIDKIVELQGAKLEADKEIEKLRAQLKALEVKSIDPTAVLGALLP